MVREVAKEIVNGLKSQPFVLALVIINVMVFMIAFWVLHELLELSSKRFDQMMVLLNECRR